MALSREHSTWAAYHCGRWGRRCWASRHMHPLPNPILTPISGPHWRVKKKCIWSDALEFRNVSGAPCGGEMSVEIVTAAWSRMEAQLGNPWGRLMMLGTLCCPNWPCAAHGTGHQSEAHFHVDSSRQLKHQAQNLADAAEIY